MIKIIDGSYQNKKSLSYNGIIIEFVSFSSVDVVWQSAFSKGNGNSFIPGPEGCNNEMNFYEEWNLNKVKDVINYWFKKQSKWLIEKIFTKNLNLMFENNYKGFT